MIESKSMIVYGQSGTRATYLQPMGNDQDGRASEVVLDDLGDRRICLSINAACSFIQNQNLVASEQCPSNNEQLFLSYREAAVSQVN